MDVKVLNQKNNPFLQRKEAECIINFEGGTPKGDEIKQSVAKALTAHPDMVVINKFVIRAGAKQGKAEVFVYDSKDALEKSIKKKRKKEEKKK